MRITNSKLRKQDFFRFIDWKDDQVGWHSSKYIERVNANEDGFEREARWLQQISLEIFESPFFKASINRISFEVDETQVCRPSNMRIELVSRDEEELIELLYKDVAAISTNMLQVMLLDGELLGFELVREGKGIRNALLFIAFHYAIIEAKSVEFSIRSR